MRHDLGAQTGVPDLTRPAQLEVHACVRALDTMTDFPFSCWASTALFVCFCLLLERQARPTGNGDTRPWTPPAHGCNEHRHLGRFWPGDWRRRRRTR